MKADPVVKAIKGFDLNMQCRGYQFAIGETYEQSGVIEACKNGFHSIEGNPLEVFDYYPPSTSIFCDIEASGSIARHGGDSKIASARLKVVARLTWPDLIGRAIAWITAQCDPAKAEHATGNQSASSATGYRSASSATGDQSASSATGDQSASSATGKNSVAMNIGLHGRARAGEGGAIVLCEHDANGNLIAIRASKVLENGIEPDVYYALKGGEFVKAESQS